MNVISEIKKQLNKPQFIIGAEETLKELRKGNIVKAYLSVNPKPELVADIESLAKLSDVELVRLDVPNDELGTVCKKPFPISIIGIKKQ